MIEQNGARRRYRDCFTSFDLVDWLLRFALVITACLVMHWDIQSISKTFAQGLSVVVGVQNEETIAAKRRADETQTALGQALGKIDGLTKEVKAQVDRQTALANQAAKASYDAKRAGEKAAEASRMAHAAAVSTKQTVTDTVVTTEDKAKLNKQQAQLQTLTTQYRQDLKIVKKQLKQKR